MLDMDLVLIFSFVVVITTIAGIAINRIVSKVYAHQRWEKEQDHANSGTPVNQLAERTDLIEDRLRVLERLATDRGVTLADEIEALRDERADAGVPLPTQHDKEMS